MAASLKNVHVVNGVADHSVVYSIYNADGSFVQVDNGIGKIIDADELFITLEDARKIVAEHPGSYLVDAYADFGDDDDC